jgi:ferrous iron transport protein A
MMLRRRQASQGQSDSSQSVSTVVLSQLAPGQHATVVGTVPQADAAVAGRLWQLGFRPAAHVDVVRRAPLGDPTIYRVQDTELCLRGRQARLIEVLPEADR